MSMRRSSGFLMGLFLVFLLSSLSFPALLAENGDSGEKNENPPVLSNMKSSSSPRGFGSDVIFRITYRDEDNNQPEEIVLIFDDEKYPLKESDPDDTNVSNGKVYLVKEHFKQGTYLYYIKASDGKHNVTTAPTFIILDDEIEFHVDLAIILSVVMVPIVFIIYYLKQLNTSLRTLTEEVSRHLPLFVEEGQGLPGKEKGGGSAAEETKDPGKGGS